MNVRTWLLACLSTLALVACGHHSGNSGDTDGGGSGTGDGSGSGTGDGGMTVDAPPFGGTCTAGNPQCSDCVDNDGDGRIDGFDPECTGPFDNDEATFATGIPGDNKDAINEDCFFDGDSGAGNDGCNQHVCCLLGATTKTECAQDLVGLVNNPTQEGNKYDVTQCFAPLGSATVPQQCIDVCGAITPPGCDCFGCCTICDPTTNMCYDIAINPATSPNCTPDKISDPTVCHTCVKSQDCGQPCGAQDCILCPGQDPSDLPSSCGGTTMCPSGYQTCDVNNPTCPDQTYCSAGCCVGVIQ